MFDGDLLSLRCLVVDDHRDGAEALGAFLTILGLDVRVVFSGRGAIELAQTFQPRMVVLDINMPGLDGFETAKRLKQQGWARNAIFIAHTGMGREATSGAVFADFHHVLTKGDGSEALEAIVDKLRVSD
jgi:CheY-like chemotaxis protein